MLLWTSEGTISPGHIIIEDFEPQASTLLENRRPWAPTVTLTGLGEKLHVRPIGTGALIFLVFPSLANSTLSVCCLGSGLSQETNRRKCPQLDQRAHNCACERTPRSIWPLSEDGKKEPEWGHTTGCQGPTVNLTSLCTVLGCFCRNRVDVCSFLPPPPSPVTHWERKTIWELRVSIWVWGKTYGQIETGLQYPSACLCYLSAGFLMRSFSSHQFSSSKGLRFCFFFFGLCII